MSGEVQPSESKPANAEYKHRQTGRPTRYNEEMADEICFRLAEGEPLAKICRDAHMPGYSTVRRWEDENETFRALSTRARQDGTRFMADDCIMIADDPKLDAQDKRVRIDTRLRLIGKWNPKEFDDSPTQVIVNTPGLSPDQMAQVELIRERREALKAERS